MPIAVPSSTMPKSSRPQQGARTSCCSVSGHCVNAVPAKITSPIRSCAPRAARTPAATVLATPSRLSGWKSSARIDVEMSSASTMSTPRPRQLALAEPLLRTRQRHRHERHRHGESANSTIARRSRARAGSQPTVEKPERGRAVPAADAAAASSASADEHRRGSQEPRPQPAHQAGLPPRGAAHGVSIGRAAAAVSASCARGASYGSRARTWQVARLEQRRAALHVVRPRVARAPPGARQLARGVAGLRASRSGAPGSGAADPRQPRCRARTSGPPRAGRAPRSAARPPARPRRSGASSGAPGRGRAAGAAAAPAPAPAPTRRPRRRARRAPTAIHSHGQSPTTGRAPSPCRSRSGGFSPRSRGAAAGETATKTRRPGTRPSRGFPPGMVKRSGGAGTATCPSAKVWTARSRWRCRRYSSFGGAVVPARPALQRVVGRARAGSATDARRRPHAQGDASPARPGAAVSGATSVSTRTGRCAAGAPAAAPEPRRPRDAAARTSGPGHQRGARAAARPRARRPPPPRARKKRSSGGRYDAPSTAHRLRSRAERGERLRCARGRRRGRRGNSSRDPRVAGVTRRVRPVSRSSNSIQPTAGSSRSRGSSSHSATRSWRRDR